VPSAPRHPNDGHELMKRGAELLRTLANSITRRTLERPVCETKRPEKTGTETSPAPSVPFNPRHPWPVRRGRGQHRALLVGTQRQRPALPRLRHPLTFRQCEFRRVAHSASSTARCPRGPNSPPTRRICNRSGGLPVASHRARGLPLRHIPMDGGGGPCAPESSALGCVLSSKREGENHERRRRVRHH